MGLIEYPDLEQGSEEWLKARCGMVTASVVGQLITPSTRKVASNDTSRGLLASLVAERITGEVEPTYTSDDMMRGILHEPIARDLYSQHWAPVTEMGFMVRKESGWRLGYSPDGLVGDDGLIEIKCPRAKAHVQTILADEVPPQYVAQCQAGLFVTGRAWLDFVSFRAGLPLYRKRVLPDERWHDAIAAAVAAFERAAEAMTDDYLRKVEGLPATERVPEFEDMRI